MIYFGEKKIQFEWKLFIVLQINDYIPKYWLRRIKGQRLNMEEQEPDAIITKLQTSNKEGNVLFNNTLNTFYLRLYGVRHMVKDHTDSKRGNPLLPRGLHFPISKVFFICTIPQTG